MIRLNLGFPGGTGGTEPACQGKRYRSRGLDSLGREDPLEEGMATHLLFLPGEIHGQRSLGDYGPQGHQESYTMEVT